MGRRSNRASLDKLPIPMATVYLPALFDNKYNARAVIADLLGHGFGRRDVSVLGRADPHAVLSGRADDAGVDWRMLSTADIVATPASFELDGVEYIAEGPITTALARAQTGDIEPSLTKVLTAVGLSLDAANAYADGVRAGALLVVIAVEATAAAQLQRELASHGVRAVNGTVAGTAGRDTGGRRRLQAAFAAHYQLTYGGRGAPFQEYAAAYHFGAFSAESPRYRNRQWSEVSLDLQRSWEIAHPGTWTRFRDAIRFGWGRVREARYAGPERRRETRYGIPAYLWPMPR